MCNPLQASTLSLVEVWLMAHELITFMFVMLEEWLQYDIDAVCTHLLAPPPHLTHHGALKEQSGSDGDQDSEPARRISIKYEC